MTERSSHADQPPGKLGHRRSRDVYDRQSVMTRQSEDAVEPRSRLTDAARQQGMAVLSRADSVHEYSEFELDPLRSAELSPSEVDAGAE